MPVVTIILGIALTVLGLGYYLASLTSFTALIPAAFGLPLFVLGLLALKEKLLKHAMHAAAVIGLLGFLAAGGKLLVGLASGNELNPRAATSQAIMAGLCLVFEVLCVRSFILAKRRRANSELGKPIGA